MLPLRVATLALVLPFSVHGQTSGSYRPRPDTLNYESVNSYLMFFIRGADTLGEPITTRTRERQHFAARGTDLTVWVRLQSLDGQPFSVDNTYTVTRAGRVLAEGTRPVAQAPNARVDLLPRFPDPPVKLEMGATWRDTVSVRHRLPYGDAYYSVQRQFWVHRLIDTLGTRVAHIVATGEMRLRQGGWQDSTAGTVWWQEVAGPVADTVWFDTRGGELLADVTVMSLVGTGGAGPRAGGVTMPSGLRSLVRRQRSPS